MPDRPAVPREAVEPAYGIAGRAAGEAALEHGRDGARMRSATDAFLLSRIARAVVDALVATGTLVPAPDREDREEREEGIWEAGHKAGRVFQRAQSAPDREGRSRLEGLIRRAAPFVNAVASMAEDRSEALAWLADAANLLDRKGSGAALAETEREDGDGR